MTRRQPKRSPFLTAAYDRATLTTKDRCKACRDSMHIGHTCLEVELPDFELLKRQPDPPHVAHVVMERVVYNEHGTGVRITIRAGRKHNEWWIYATYPDAHMRASNTLHTRVSSKVDDWIRATALGHVRIGGRLHSADAKGHAP